MKLKHPLCYFVTALGYIKTAIVKVTTVNIQQNTKTLVLKMVQPAYMYEWWEFPSKTDYQNLFI